MVRRRSESDALPPVAGTPTQVSKCDDQELVLANEVDNSVRERIDLAAPDDREPIPTGELGPGVGIPLDVSDGFGDLDVEFIAETSLRGLVVADGIEK